jgi:hypothetical protein
MVPTLTLWLPILLSAILVFIVSSIIHMLLPYHRSDFRKVPDEDDVMESLRRFNIPPGDYVMPCAGSSKEMGSAEFKEKSEKGPVAFITVMPSGPPAMGKSLILWFIYCLAVGAVAAYVTGRALGPGAPYLAVFRFIGATAFIGYALALWQNSIWYKRNWVATLKSNLDGFIYALATAGVFGWLWPD